MKLSAAIVARFQTPYLHEGHHFILNTVKKNHHKIVVILGVSPVKGSTRNPFDFYTRERMIRQAFPEAVVLPLKDCRTDEEWSANLDALLTDHFPAEEFLLYGGRDSFIPFYKGVFRTEVLPEAGNYSSTTIREEGADLVLDSPDFRHGINYAYHNQYPRVNPTVDIAVLKNHEYILLGKKKGCNQWRFPGGFVDPADVRYEDAASRELSEECGSIVTGEMHYIGSSAIDDWRYRNENHKIISILFGTTWMEGEPRAQDDLAVVEWIPLKSLAGMMETDQLVDEHRVLFKMLTGHLQNRNGVIQPSKY
jgi:bifunctional NMN adenylyltransferase/nudix hydrolase